ncbi:MAG: hypothetical protein FWD98_03170 [Defluviitaleaceae bacterium]|nr:hypothetical protein [Defluviitaleaceae bacterium]
MGAPATRPGKVAKAAGRRNTAARTAIALTNITIPIFWLNANLVNITIQAQARNTMANSPRRPWEMPSDMYTTAVAKSGCK